MPPPITFSAGRLAAVLAFVAVIGLSPDAALARDNLADARASLAAGDLKTAQIQLRNAVKEDPNSAEAHFQLGRLSLQLGDGAAAQTQAQQALDRGWDPVAGTELLTQAYLAQNKVRELLREVVPDGKPPEVAARILVARGFAQLSTGDAATARLSFEQAEADAPRSVQPLLADSRLASAMGDTSRAHAKLDQALALEPAAPDVLLRKAELQRVDGNAAGAMATLDLLVASSPGLLPPRLARAELSIAAEKDMDAKADVDLVLKALPGNVQANYLRAVLLFRAKDLPGTDAQLTKLAPAMNGIPRGYFLTAVVKQQLGQLAQAEEAAERFLSRAPNDPVAQKLVAEIALVRGKPDRAVAVLQATADSPRADAAVYDLIARGFASTGHPDRAVEYFEKESALAPDDAGLRTRLAASRIGMGDTERAVSDLQKSFDLAPKEAAPAAQLFFADLATGDLDRTAASLEKIRQAQGDTPLVQSLDGQLKLARLDEAGARAVFEKLVREHPEFVQGKVSLARLAIQQGHSDEAEGLLASILKDAPTSEPALTMMVVTQFADKKPDDAIATLRRAHDAAPRDTRITAGLADTLTRANDPAAAVKVLADPALGTDASIELLAGRSRAQLALKDDAGVQASYRAILALDAHAVEVRRALAGLLLRGNNPESARTLLEEGMRADPRDMRLVEDYVGLDQRTKGVDAALATADRLRRNAPDVTAMRALRGDVYLGDNKPEQAAAEYAREMQAEPDQLILLRLVNADILSGKRDDAATALRAWSTTHPDDLAATQSLASVVLGANKYDEAEPLLTSILTRAPRDASALNNLAWIYSVKNDPRALGLAQRAYLLGPSPATADTLGWILTSKGDAAKGVVLLRQANVDGRNPQIAYHLAVALKDTGHADEAKQMLTTLTRSDAKFDEKPEAEKLLSDLSKG